MGQHHDTIPNEPQEAPVQPQRPEIQQPDNPQGTVIPQEAPQQPNQGGSELNQTEV